MSVDDLEKKEEEEFRTGPLSVLTTSVKTNSQVRDAVQDSGCTAMLWFDAYMQIHCLAVKNTRCHPTNLLIVHFLIGEVCGVVAASFR